MFWHHCPPWLPSTNGYTQNSQVRRLAFSSGWSVLECHSQSPQQWGHGECSWLFDRRTTFGRRRNGIGDWTTSTPRSDENRAVRWRPLQIGGGKRKASYDVPEKMRKMVKSRHLWDIWINRNHVYFTLQETYIRRESETSGKICSTSHVFCLATKAWSRLPGWLWEELHLVSTRTLRLALEHSRERFAEISLI